MVGVRKNHGVLTATLRGGHRSRGPRLQEGGIPRRPCCASTACACARTMQVPTGSQLGFHCDGQACVKSKPPWTLCRVLSAESVGKNLWPLQLEWF